MLLSMNELTTYRWSFEEDVVNYANAGYTAIGIWRRKVEDFGVERAIELLQESGLRVSSLLWAGGFTGNDGRTHTESVEDAREAIALADQLGAENLLLYSGGSDLHIRKHCDRLLSNALDSLLPIAEEFDVRLALKPMHPAAATEWTFLTDLGDTLHLLERYASPHLGLALDLFHFADDRKLMALLPRLAEHLAVVSVGDRLEPITFEQNRCTIGNGFLPLSRIVPALLEEGYDGFFEIELLGPESETAIYRHHLEASRDRLMEFAATARTLESF